MESTISSRSILERLLRRPSRTFAISCGLAAAVAFALTTIFASVTPAYADMTCPSCGSAMVFDVFQPATCDVPGSGCYSCVNPECNEPGYVDVVIPATGHNFSREVSRTNPTCTSGGSVTYACTNISMTGGECGVTTTQTLSALGHSWGGWIVDIPATEEQQGHQYRTCSRCGARDEAYIPALAPAEEEEGEEDETDKEEEPAITEAPDKTLVTEKEDSGKTGFPWGLVLGFVVLAAFAGLAFGMFIRPRMLAKAAARAAAAAAADEAGMAKAISTAFKNNPKTILLCVGENNVGGPLVRALEGRHYLSVRSLDLDQLYSLPEEAAEMKPDLIVLHLFDMRSWADVSAIMECTREVYEDARFGLLVSDPGDIDEYNHLKREMDALKENEVILGYVFDSEVETNGFIRLVLPLYKETIVSDNSPMCIGIVADLLGIPGVSTVVSTFTSGRQIKDVMAAGDLSAGDKAVIIADIAEALGLSQVVSVAALVDYTNTIQRTVKDDGKVSGRSSGEE